jgi:hypothetical protein
MDLILSLAVDIIDREAYVSFEYSLSKRSSLTTLVFEIDGEKQPVFN